MTQQQRSNMPGNARRLFLITSGWLSVGLGVAGIIVPLLPTTPFILLAGGCFARSSPRFHQWLLNHKFFGALIKNYHEKQGLPRDVKIRAIIFIWITLSISIYLMPVSWLKVCIFMLGLILTGLLWRTPENNEKRHL